MSVEWVKVFSTIDLFRAEIIKSMLIDDGINTVLVNKKDSMQTYINIGDAEIFVGENDIIKAKHLIAKFEA